MNYLIKTIVITVLLSSSIGALKAQESSFLVASPTEVVFRYPSFDAVDVNIKTAGISSLAALTSFDIVVQGRDAQYFDVGGSSLPPLSFLIQMLLGDGFTFSVKPSILTEVTRKVGREAEILVTATFLGLLAPVQTTIPLTYIPKMD